MGDPAGIGPELCQKILHESAQIFPDIQLVVFGDLDVWKQGRDNEDNLGLLAIEKLDQQAPAEGPLLVDCGGMSGHDVVPGEVNAQTGAASFDYVNQAIDAALAGEVAAVVTGPIHKQAWQVAGAGFTGHTELLVARTAAPQHAMMLTSPEITCSLVTTHVGISDVSRLLTASRILEVIELTNHAISRIRDSAPRLALCGLNPHAGEGGLIGDNEESRMIEPALAEARHRGIQIVGPLPPDTAFLPQQRKVIDAYICMYHDQGLIPLKTLAFDEAVNVTLGLPIVRTSVDHGPALDIAGQGIASPKSMIAAVRYACRLIADSVDTADNANKTAYSNVNG